MQVNSALGFPDRNDVATQGNVSLEKGSKSNDIFSAILGNINNTKSQSAFSSSLNIGKSVNASSFEKNHMKDKHINDKSKNKDDDFKLDDDDDEDKKKKEAQAHERDLSYALSILTESGNQNNFASSNNLQNLKSQNTNTQSTLLKNNELVHLDAKMVEDAVNNTNQKTNNLLNTASATLDQSATKAFDAKQQLSSSNTVNPFADIESSDMEVNLENLKNNLDKMASMPKLDSEQNLNKMAKEASVSSVSLRDVVETETSSQKAQQDLSLEKAFKQTTLKDLNIVKEDGKAKSENQDASWKLSVQNQQNAKSATASNAVNININNAQNTQSKIASALNTLKGALTNRNNENSLESMNNLKNTAKGILESATQALSQVVTAAQDGSALQNSTSQNQSQSNLLFTMQNSAMLDLNTEGTQTSAKTFKEHMNFSRNLDDNAKELANKVMKMASKNLKEMEIDLDPKNLGKMKIIVGINKDNDAASVSIAASNAQTKEMLEGSLGRLRDILSQNGVETEANVYDYLEQESNNSKQQGQERQQSNREKNQENEILSKSGLVFAEGEDNGLEVNYLTQATKDLKFGSTSNQELSFFA